jgi:glyoxylase I family protein
VTVRLHHVWIGTTEVQKMRDFYQQILGLQPIVHPGRAAGNETDSSGGEIRSALLAAGEDPDELQVHFGVPDHNLVFAREQMVNPKSLAHVAYRCDDIEAIKSRLRSANVPFADFGEWAVKGWYQIYFYDPAGTVIEVQQVSP